MLSCYFVSLIIMYLCSWCTCSIPILTVTPAIPLILLSPNISAMSGNYCILWPCNTLTIIILNNKTIIILNDKTFDNYYTVIIKHLKCRWPHEHLLITMTYF